MSYHFEDYPLEDQQQGVVVHDCWVLDLRHHVPEAFFEPSAPRLL